MNAIAAFVVVTYVLSLALSLVVGLTGGQQSSFIGLAYLAMLIPAAAVVAVNAVTGDRLAIDWNRLPLGYLPLALFLMPVVMHLSMLPTAAALEGTLTWHDWLRPQADGLYHTPAQPGWGALTASELAGCILLNAAIGLLVVSVLAIFEEIGWRAWFLPRLVQVLGTRRALVGTAVIAAGWHMPYVISGVHHIDGVSVEATAVIMFIGHVGAALIIGWLWLRTTSIWLVALAHGALNNWGQYAFKYMRDFVIADSGLVLASGNLALLLVGAILLRAAAVNMKEEWYP